MNRYSASSQPEGTLFNRDTATPEKRKAHYETRKAHHEEEIKNLKDEREKMESYYNTFVDPTTDAALAIKKDIDEHARDIRDEETQLVQLEKVYKAAERKEVKRKIYEEKKEQEHTK